MLVRAEEVEDFQVQAFVHWLERGHGAASSLYDRAKVQKASLLLVDFPGLPALFFQRLIAWGFLLVRNGGGTLQPPRDIPLEGLSQVLELVGGQQRGPQVPAIFTPGELTAGAGRRQKAPLQLKLALGIAIARKCAGDAVKRPPVANGMEGVAGCAHTLLKATLEFFTGQQLRHDNH